MTETAAPTQAPTADAAAPAPQQPVPSLEAAFGNVFKNASLALRGFGVMANKAAVVAAQDAQVVAHALSVETRQLAMAAARGAQGLASDAQQAAQVVLQDASVVAKAAASEAQTMAQDVARGAQGFATTAQTAAVAAAAEAKAVAIEVGAAAAEAAATAKATVETVAREAKVVASKAAAKATAAANGEPMLRFDDDVTAATPDEKSQAHGRRLLPSPLPSDPFVVFTQDSTVLGQPLGSRRVAVVRSIDEAATRPQTLGEDGAPVSTVDVEAFKTAIHFKTTGGSEADAAEQLAFPDIQADRFIVDISPSHAHVYITFDAVQRAFIIKSASAGPNDGPVAVVTSTTDVTDVAAA
ncbi:hypothetical protein BC831DRAFT_476053 [Entophlyctis helioformis]|nr:hypothetical protein BC831DRAFT_476053 [Entophlyctis helioformis]